MFAKGPPAVMPRTLDVRVRAREKRNVFRHPFPCSRVWDGIDDVFRKLAIESIDVMLKVCTLQYGLRPGGPERSDQQNNVSDHKSECKARIELHHARTARRREPAEIACLDSGRDAGKVRMVERIE